MATLLELRDIYRNNSDLREKVEAAIIVEVAAILDGTPSAADQKYVSYVLANIAGEADKILKYIIGKNDTLTRAQIDGAADVAIKSSVSTVMANLNAAFNAP